MLNEYALNGYTVNSNLPIGIVIPSFSDVVPVGFLNCDHTKLKQSDFPELWNELKDVPMCQSEEEGYFFTPDLREVSLVGAGENGTLNITAHDLYTLGQFKDDQFQGHWHNIADDGKAEGGGNNRGALCSLNGSNDTKVRNPISDGVNGDPRTGTTTHGKQVGVKWIIKATQYASLEQNAIDDTRTTNANVHSALQTQTDISNALEWKLLVEKQIRGSFTIPDNAKEVLLFVYTSDNQCVGQAHILTEILATSTAIDIPSNDVARSKWDVNGRTLTKASSSGEFEIITVYYR